MDIINDFMSVFLEVQARSMELHKFRVIQDVFGLVVCYLVEEHSVES